VLIALQGKSGHGKTTIAAYLCARHRFTRMRFAAPLKEQIGWQLLRMTEAQTDGFLREAPCVDLATEDLRSLAAGTLALLFPDGGRRYGLSREELLARWEEIYSPLFRDGHLRSPREILQRVGGGARSLISPEVWVDLWRDRYRTLDATRVVVDDLRYPNEKSAIEAEGGEVWRSVRTDRPAPLGGDASEIACDQLSDGAFAVTLRRSGSVPDLLRRVDELVEARTRVAVEEAG